MIQKALLGDVVLNDYLDFNTLDYDDSNLYQVAYGGGKNSTAMIIKLIQLKAPIDVIIMSDTKAEMPETYEYLPIFKKWLSENAPHIPFHIVIEKDGLTEASFKKKKLPIIARRWCTKDYKIAPMRRLLRSIMREKNKKTVVSYVGIHYHESHRMKPADVLYVKHCYPLVDLKLKEADCIEIIKKAGLPIPVKSGCFYCPFQSKAKWVDLYKKHPDLWELSKKLEANADDTFNRKSNNKRVPLSYIEDAQKHQQSLDDQDWGDSCGGDCMT